MNSFLDKTQTAPGLTPVGDRPAAGKKKFPAASAIQVAQSIVAALAPSCQRIEIAGSLRRRKQEVGDIEILYVAKTAEQTDLLGSWT